MNGVEREVTDNMHCQKSLLCEVFLTRLLRIDDVDR